MQAGIQNNNSIYKIPTLKIIKGKKHGKTSIIMAGTHGNETCGVNAFKNIIPNLSIENGRVIFVIGNPKALKKNVRFTEFNLNRAFLSSSKYSKEVKKTYEYKRAQELKKILKKGDALLDIHSTLKKAKPFIICEKSSQNIVSNFPKGFKKIVYGFNGIEPGATDGYMLSNGGIGIGIECGQHESKQAIKLAERAIFSFLKIRGHLNLQKNEVVKKREIVQMNYIYRTKTNSFILARNFLNFEKIKKGTIIGIDGKQKLVAKNDCIILFAHNRGKKNEEAYLLGKILE